MMKSSFQNVLSAAGDHSQDGVGVAGGIASTVLDAVGVEFAYAGLIGDAINVGITAYQCKGKIDRTPNPRFVQHGLAEAHTPSPKVKKYFKDRKLKQMSGSVFSLVGSGVGLVTQANLANVAKHGRSSVKTIAHITRLKQLAKGFKQSRYLQELCDELIKLKTIKAASQGSQLAMDAVAAVPVAGSVAEGAVNAGVSIALNAMLRKEADIIVKTAQELHFRAYQELFFVNQIGKGGHGPAMRMVRELFGQAIRIECVSSSKHKAIRHLHPGNSRADKFILEPAGWLVLVDKLTLI